ncbi:hypothetical protein DFP92_10240 [Yoonia sediminilitoris]|uniref:Uncharacterized protein n=1 Tax=Yoonia sediminilitoris TaxID=1286148 RepID=A0A2T6KLE7_9RHOB|nr:hypothetical protein C8N45_10240 [Yoonia sediminilitoris]RCW97325.1 hypothetical protein DFP92_10240 [Yoonia sediminilitoris]
MIFNAFMHWLLFGMVSIFSSLADKNGLSSVRIVRLWWACRKKFIFLRED